MSDYYEGQVLSFSESYDEITLPFYVQKIRVTCIGGKGGNGGKGNSSGTSGSSASEVSALFSSIPMKIKIFVGKNGSGGGSNYTHPEAEDVSIKNSSTSGTVQITILKISQLRYAIEEQGKIKVLEENDEAGYWKVIGEYPEDIDSVIEEGMKNIDHTKFKSSKVRIICYSPTLKEEVLYE